jgi:hypothetical protein
LALIQVRFYDLRESKKRPTFDYQIDKHGLGSLVSLQDNQHILCGSNIGEVFMLDRRKNCHIVRKFNEAHGTITDMDLHRNGGYFCTGIILVINQSVWTADAAYTSWRPTA